MKITRLLSFSNKIPFYFYLGHLGRSYSSDRYSVCGTRPRAIPALNAELPPLKNGECNSENASTIDRIITPLSNELNNSESSFLLGSVTCHCMLRCTQFQLMLPLDELNSMPVKLGLRNQMN